jgi:flagellar protein FlaJ
MVSLLGLVPLVVAIGLVAVTLLAKVNDRVDRRLTRIALGVFGRYVDEDRLERKRMLQSAHVPETYRAYATKSVLFTGFLSFAGGIIAVYIVGGVIVSIPAIGDLLGGLPTTMTAAVGYPSEWELELTARELFVVLTVGGSIGGLITGGLTYTMRWRLPKGRAEARRRHINEGLARTVAFLYALSRGGMAFPEVMRTLANNREVYGETADEISVAVREMDLFGTDMISAIQHVTQRTPSEEFKTFGENLSSVLQSGQNISTFLRDQYDRYQSEAEERQEAILERLATIAEAYVTILVAGTLFLITILLVFGLTTTDTLWILQLLAYLAIPLANLGFMLFLAQQLELLGVAREGSAVVPENSAVLSVSDSSTSDIRAADGGHIESIEANFERLAAYDRLKGVQTVLRRPLKTILWNPTSIFYITVPLAILWVVLRVPAALTGVGVNVRVLDDILVQAALFLIGTFAIVRFFYTRRLDRIEAAIPEFLERLASLNEAGMSVVESFSRVRGSDLGALTDEVERIWTDVTLGANVDEALVRFGNRVQTVPVTRAVTLLTNSMRASSNIGSVMRIASEQARADLRLRRRRSRQMLTYLVVIYIAFAVFLVIIVAVQEVLIPSLPSSVPTPPADNRLGVDAQQFTRLGSVDKAAYTLVFFHTALIQAILSGFIGGQLGEGTVKDGAKHALIMLGIAYVAFLLLSAPVASLNFEQQVSQGDTVVVESASLSDGGYIVLHARSPTGEVVGRSEYLPPGKSTDVTIELDKDIGEETEIFAVPHRDTNDNREFEYAGGSVDRVYPPGREAVTAAARITFF